MLSAELMKGREVIPLNKSCSNPCKHAGCAGFDFTGSGYPGFVIVDADTDISGDPVPVNKTVTNKDVK